MISITLVKYLAVGVLNAIVGFGTTFLLMWQGMSPELANVLGYVVGVCFSFVVNKIFTFESKAGGKKSVGEFVRFVSSMLIAWSCNCIFLKICLKAGVNPYLAQLISGATYTACGYILSKTWAFKKR